MENEGVMAKTLKSPYFSKEKRDEVKWVVKRK
jgi:ATP-dependent DNA ligase